MEKRKTRTQQRIKPRMTKKTLSPNQGLFTKPPPSSSEIWLPPSPSKKWKLWVNPFNQHQPNVFINWELQSFYGTLLLFWFIELTAYRCVRDILDLLEWPSRTLSLRGGSSEEPGWHLRGKSTSKRFAGTWTTSGWLTLYFSTQNIESIKPMNISLVLWAKKIYMFVFKWTVKILSMRYIFLEQRRQFYTIFYLNIFSTAEGLWTWSYIKSWTQTESATCQWNLRSQTSGPCRH